jgi:ATP-dependent DNA helicase RecG
MQMKHHIEKVLDGLLEKGRECEWVEFKLNYVDPQEIGEYCSALANSAFLCDEPYGYLVFGIKDGNLMVVGTNFKFSSAKVGTQELENWIATQLDPQVDFKVFEFEYDGKPMTLIRVDATRIRPIAFRGKEFVRVGSYKKSLKDHPEKERRIWEKAASVTFETRTARSPLSGDDVLRLLDYPKYFELTEQNLPSNKDGILRRLAEEALIASSEDGQFCITNLGAILFSKNLSEFEPLWRKSVRVIKYKGKNRLHTVKEHEAGKGYATGFEDLVAYINDQLPANEEIGQALRKEVRVFPEVAIRELVANMLIHQDFDLSGAGPMVELFDDRIEISNPGRPLIDTLRFIDHNPRSRNEKLAYFMRRIRVCEERGSGIDKVIQAIELFQLPAPKFLTENEFCKVVMYAPKSLRQMTKEDKVRACYQHCCLKYVSNDVMTNETARERFQIKEKNYSIASRIIGDAVEAEMIKPADPTSKSRKLASYVPFWA